MPSNSSVKETDAEMFSMAGKLAIMKGEKTGMGIVNKID